jgi:hypothetical protein
MFRFTIRDVLWLTVVLGLALGWLLDHRELTHRNDHLWSHMLRKGSALTFISFAIDSDGDYRTTFERIREILKEEDEASRKSPSPLLRDGHSN